ncbi:MAG: OmpA family protein [Candidatus Dechloromonas phosphoritropha]|jgi:outer membrane protein OmpA-like peptidoglycan-associated protein
MAANDDDESTAVIVGVLAGIALAVLAVVYSGSSTKAVNVAKAPTDEVVEIAPLGEPLAKVYFAVGEARLTDADMAVVALTLQALAANSRTIVLLSGFHDPSGDARQNAELARARALSVRDALVAGGVPADRCKLRKPESNIGSGSPEESRRVEIRVQ